ncbi:hypothetical protein ZWY2020_022099, partial [Hordeum vulgare]
MRSTHILLLAFSFMMLSSAMATSNVVCNHIVRKGECNYKDCLAYYKKFTPHQVAHLRSAYAQDAS